MADSLGREKGDAGVKYRGGRPRGMERCGLSFSCLIFRCTSGTSVFYLPRATSLQYVFVDYICSDIAQV